ncbi:MAG: AMP-binding protein, partial [Paracoccaceae bacterium]
MANPLYDALFRLHQGKTTPFLELADGTIIKHFAFLQMAAQYAHVLRHLGVETGDRVAVQAGKSPQALAVYAACVQAGFVFLPLNTAYTAHEVAYFVNNSGARVILCEDAKKTALAPIADAAGATIKTLNDDGSGSFATLSESMPDVFPTVERSQHDLAAFL